MPFLVITFSILNYFWLVVCNSFHKIMKSFINLFITEMTNNICPWYSTFYIFHHKDFRRSIWCVALRKTIFVFWYFQMTTKFEFRIFFIILNSILIIHTRCVINMFQYRCYATMISLICCKTHCTVLPIFCLVYDQTHEKLFEMHWWF